MTRSLEPGSEFGAYRIIERVGKGGMATVYRAHQADLARYVAIKVLPDFLAEDQDFKIRFQQEAVAVANLRHPSIPAVYHYGDQEGIAYIVTEFIDGGTLADQTGKPLPLPYTIEMLAPIASAIDYAHSRGVLHRDVKPPNILMTRDGRPVLNDFGLARMMESEKRVTQGAMIMGTPQYMSPEQCLGEDIGPATDIYALAVVAYEMLTGRVPFTAATPAAVIMAHVRDALPPPRSINPELSPEVENVLLKGLAKAPTERYPSATAMIQALAQARDVTGDTRLTPRPAMPRASAKGRDSRLPWVAAAGALVVVVAAVAGYLATRGRPGGAPAGDSAQTVGSAWITAAPMAQAQPVPRGLPIWRAALAPAGTALGTPDLFGGSPTNVILRQTSDYLDVALKANSSRVRLLTAMPPQANYIGEVTMAIRPGSRLTVRWVTRTVAGGDHAMALRGDAQVLEYGFYPGSGGVSEVANNPAHPELFTGRPFTLTADGQQDGSFSVFLNQEQIGNYSGGHPSDTSTMGFEAFGTGEFRVLAAAAYQRP